MLRPVFRLTVTLRHWFTLNSHFYGYLCKHKTKSFWNKGLNSRPWYLIAVQAQEHWCSLSQVLCPALSFQCKEGNLLVRNSTLKLTIHNLIENWLLEIDSVTCSPFNFCSYVKRYFSIETTYLFRQYPLELQVQIFITHHLIWIHFVLI